VFLISYEAIIMCALDNGLHILHFVKPENNKSTYIHMIIIQYISCL